jgi:tetratricopeptide (TPR) repeat protein
VRADANRLLHFAVKKLPLVPAEVGPMDRGAGLALALGRVAALMGRQDQAVALFTSVQSGRIKGTTIQISFAALGVARAFAAKDDLARAKEAYLASLKSSERAAFHDETLRELALLIERQAGVPPLGGAGVGVPALAGQNGKGGAGGNPPPRGGTPTAGKPPTLQEASPYWQKLIAQFPASPHAPEALDHAANLQLAADQWKPASENLEKLVKDYPASPWAGSAYAALIDIRLERLLDLEGAQKYADAAVKWYEATSPRPLGEGQGEGGAKSPRALGEGQATGSPRPYPGEGPGVRADSADPFSPFPPTPARAIREVAYDTYLRAGLLEYLHEQFGAALAFFEKAKPFEPPQKIHVVYGHISTGIEQLIEVAKSGKTLTPEIVAKGDPTAKTAMLLADVYQEAQEFDKSIEMCSRLLASAAIKRATPEQRSYAFFRRGRDHYLILPPNFDAAAALADYLAAVNAAPKAPWAGQAMFLAGNLDWNHLHKPAEAIAVWQRAIREYPKDADADRCAFYIGLAYFFTNQFPEAQKAMEKYIADYPASDFIADAKDIVDQSKAKLAETAKGAKK